ncbi:Bacterial membrane flanked domain protein [Corynebacterium ciconiae DSM 44920]|nr:Bacterial membrane flanked domain protein [Corynebacterium ciconiae DSM 44920]
MSENQQPHTTQPAVTADNADFQRVHPLTPLLRFWSALLAVIVAIAINQRELASGILGVIRDYESFELVPVLLSVAGTVALLGFTWALSRIWWKRNGYRLGSDEVVVEKGVFTRQSRSARCDRIHAVDVTEPFLARLAGLAAVRIETAGGNDSVLEIQYLKKATAEQVKEIVLRHSRAEQDTAGGEQEDIGASQTEAADPHPRSATVMAAVPVRQALAALALQWSSILTVVALIAVVVTPIGFGFFIPIVLGGAPAMLSFVNRAWNFRAEHNEHTHELRLRYGLTERRSQTVPLHRVHAVALTQPLLWRKLGWWKLTVSVAGYGDITGSSSTTTVLPVGDYDTATALCVLLSPVTQEDLDGPARPGELRAPTVRSPRQARWFRPLSYRYRGITLVDDYAVIHTGRFSCTMSVVELEHIQELTLSGGPLQQRLGLVSVRLDLVDGPVQMQIAHIDTEEGFALLNRLRQRKLPALHSPETPAAATPHRPQQPQHSTDSSISVPPASGYAPER